MKASQKEILVTSNAARRFPADLQQQLAGYPADAQGCRMVPRQLFEQLAAERLTRLPAPCTGCTHRGRVYGDQVHCRAAGSCDAPANRIGFSHACPLGLWDARNGSLIDAR